MKSLSFDDLPLVAVEAAITFTPPFPAFRLTDAAVIANAAPSRGGVASINNARMALATDLASALVTPLQADQVGLLIVERPSLGLTTYIQENVVIIKWQKGIEGHPYVRYGPIADEMRWVLELLARTLPDSGAGAKIVNLNYQNYVPGFGGEGQSAVERYINRPFRAAYLDSAEKVHEIRLRWHTADGFDRALNFLQAHMGTLTDGYLLSTISGKMLESNIDPMNVLDQCHDDLQALFLEIITDAAKSEWGYDGGR